MPPTVSIILPTWNRLTLLREAVESVRAQTMTEWELIVVDDGSTEASAAWLASLGDPRIRVVRLEHTGRIGFVRNVGVATAVGDWIAFIDSDDRWRPRKLELQLALHLANARIRWSYSGRTMIGADGMPLPVNQFKAWEPHSGWVLAQVLALDANIALPCVMVQRALLAEVGGFDATLPGAEDYDLWLRLAERSECGVMNDALADIRSHASTTLGQPDVNLGFVQLYGRFAARTTDHALAALARRRQSIHAVSAAHTLITLGRWHEAWTSIRVARRLRPLSPTVHLATARLLWRRAKHFRRAPGQAPAPSPQDVPDRTT